MKRKKMTKYDWIKMVADVAWTLFLGAVMLLPPQYIPPVSTWFDANIRGTENALYLALFQSAFILVFGLAGIFVIHRKVNRKARGKRD